MSQTGPPADAKQAQAAALQELEAAQKRKRAIDTSLATLESSIYAFENSYLEESAASGGNIIKGFDNYLKPPAAINKKKLEVTNEDRLFSTSSGSFAQSPSTTTTTTLYSLDPATLTNPTAGGIIDPTLLRGGRPVLVIPPTPLPSLRKTTTSRIGSASTAYAPERTPTLAALETSVHDAPRLTYKAARFSSVPAGLRPTHNQVSPFATEALSDPGAISSAPAAHENMPGLADEVDIQIQAMLDESQPEPDFDQASAEDDQRPARSRSRAKRNQATRAMDGDRGTRGPAGKEGANGRSRKIKRSRSYTSSASARE